MKPDSPITSRFEIVARGVGFDPDGFIRQNSLEVTTTWRPEDIGADGQTPQGDSGLRIGLGDEDELEFEDQQIVAQRYLEANADVLKRLRCAPKVKTFYIGLEERLLPYSGGSILDLSPQFMQSALKVGIQVTVWIHKD